MRAAILAIGTELTTGQITNRNAAWISEQLEQAGITTVMHLTVADDRTAILDALQTIEAHAELLFVTGGLGPTSDDFTREVIAQWMDQELQWNETAWNKIETRLGGLGIRVATSNRQQAYFPRGARVLPNREGTADAFAFEKSGSRGTSRVWVLPGPPREISAVWEDHVSGELAAYIPRAEKRELLLWQLLGKSEAEVGEITEATLAGSGLQTGYRAHRPYVEVKVWAPSETSRTIEQNAALARLDATLAPWTVAHGKPEFALQLVEKLCARSETRKKIFVFDQLTHGVLAESLLPVFRSRTDTPTGSLQFEVISQPTLEPLESVNRLLDAADSQSIVFALAGWDEDGRFVVGMNTQGRKLTETVQSPWKRTPALLDRSQRFASETALRIWGTWL